MDISLTEIFDLLTVPRNTKQNRRLFEIYNHLSGRKLKPCWCSGKLETIGKYLNQYLKDNGFLNER